MPSISDDKLNKVKKLYYDEGLSMRETAERLGVSLDAVNYFMRKHGLKKRTHKESNSLVFERKKPSFSVKNNLSDSEKELLAIGAMLYWAEGYKTSKGAGIDFANSDSEMILLFLKFLRSIYRVDEKRLRVYVYCYENQDPDKLMKYWSNLTKIPISQFTKPYVRKDFRHDGRKMNNGLIHIRYSDKKLLLNMLNLIEVYKHRFK